MAVTVPTNLTPGATKLWQHYLDTFTPPTEQTLAVWKSLNTPPAMVEAAFVPHLTMHQEMMVATMMEWEKAPNAGRRYRLATKLRHNGIEPNDYREVLNATP